MNDNEIELIKEKYKDLIDKAINIMKEMNDAVHGLSHVENVVAKVESVMSKNNQINKIENKSFLQKIKEMFK